MSTAVVAIRSNAQTDQSRFSILAALKTSKTLFDAYVADPAARIAYSRPADFKSYAVALTTAVALLPLTTAFTSATIITAVAVTDAVLSRTYGPVIKPHRNPLIKEPVNIKKCIKRFVMTSGAIAGLTAIGLGGLAIQQNYVNTTKSPLAQEALARIKSSKLLVNGGPLYNENGENLGTIRIVSRNDPWSKAWNETAFHKIGQGQISALFSTKPWRALMTPGPWQELWNKMPFQSNGRIICELPQPYTNWVSGQKHQTTPVTFPFNTKQTKGERGPFHSLSLTFAEPAASPNERDVTSHTHQVDLPNPLRKEPIQQCVGPHDPSSSCRNTGINWTPSP